MTPSGFGCSAFVRVSVCAWISGKWQVQTAFGPVPLISPTHSFFLLSNLHTFGWIVCDNDLLGSLVSCSELLCSPVLTTEAILLLSHHFPTRIITGLHCIISDFPFPSLFLCYPRMSLSNCQNLKSHIREGLWLCACISQKTEWCIELQWTWKMSFSF